MNDQRLKRFCSAYLAAHPRDLLTKRERRRRALLKLAAATLAGAVLFAIESLPRAQQLYTFPKPAPQKSYHDTGERNHKLPIAYSDDTITLSFHDCRENDHHRWSCRLTDGEGDTDHYVYLPGIHPTERKAAP